MNAINSQEFIAELVFCLKEHDIVKAKALLQFASDANVNAETQKKALLELGKGPEKIVFPLLEFLAKIDIASPQVKEGLYDLILDKAYGNTDLVIKYISQNDKPTRLLFLKATADLFLSDAAPALIKILETDQDTDILIAGITALGALRLESGMGPLSAMAANPDIGVRKTAIFAIAGIGSTEAADLLINFLGEDEETNKFTVEALADMENLYALEKLTSLLSSSTTIVRDTAIDQLMKIGHKSTPILTKAFKNAQADYLVHLITTLGYIGDTAAICPILDIINTQPKDANIRQAAYEAMERIPSPRTAICLAQGLQDPVESVRMSAARAIDKNLSKPLVAGLKNIVRDESSSAATAVAALIDSDAGNIFNFLVEEKNFLKLAKTHISKSAAPSTRKAFLKTMKTLGQKEFTDEASTAEEINEPEAKSDIIVVDDSKMMLKLYQNKLSALGFAPRTFNRPEDALPQILESGPKLVITDLNMPNISGLELTQEIRKKFTRQDLPILMITTQSDFVEEEDGDVQVDDGILTKSGINHILHKPFTDDDFNKAVHKFIKPHGSD